MRQKLLLHACCAPDAAVPLAELLGAGYDAACFMYGGNIHPAGEYEKRAGALVMLSEAAGTDAVIESWDPEPWIAATRGFEGEPEGGGRCGVCFAAQLEVAARYAAKNGFPLLSTSLTISPHKDPERINKIGADIAEKYGLTWIEKVWRKNEGFKRSVAESKRLGLYRQNYCGCIYSERTVRDGRRQNYSG